MKLHEYKSEFNDLISIVAIQKGIPELAVEKDYYIVMLLKNLADSEFAEKCVFKGGTSLSKCYPGSIERFSEDIDLTYLGENEMSDKQYSKKIKRIEEIMTVGFQTEKIEKERNDRNKSMFVWFDDISNRVKLEIGSSVRPDPYSPKIIKSYIHEFLESSNETDDIQKYELEPIKLNVLNIERTFIDKIMSVKRHSYCDNLVNKVRHIYDVTQLFKLPKIQKFLEDKEELKRLLILTKETDSFYLTKRGINKDYNPIGLYNFDEWQHYFDAQIKTKYETLHQDLLYTDEKQDFDEALETFKKINKIFLEIGEWFL